MNEIRTQHSTQVRELSDTYEDNEMCVVDGVEGGGADVS